MCECQPSFWKRRSWLLLLKVDYGDEALHGWSICSCNALHSPVSVILNDSQFMILHWPTQYMCGHQVSWNLASSLKQMLLTESGSNRFHARIYCLTEFNTFGSVVLPKCLHRHKFKSMTNISILMWLFKQSYHLQFHLLSTENRRDHCKHPL